jgi:hypothetical protein
MAQDDRQTTRPGPESRAIPPVLNFAMQLCGLAPEDHGLRVDAPGGDLYRSQTTVPEVLQGRWFGKYSFIVTRLSFYAAANCPAWHASRPTVALAVGSTARFRREYFIRSGPTASLSPARCSPPNGWSSSPAGAVYCRISGCPGASGGRVHVRRVGVHGQQRKVSLRPAFDWMSTSCPPCNVSLTAKSPAPP